MSDQNHCTSVHCVGELDEDRVLLHDSLDVLATNTDDSLMVLVRNMEGNRSRHFLLDKAETLLHRFKTTSHDINVEVVLVKAIEDDLNAA